MQLCPRTHCCGHGPGETDESSITPVQWFLTALRNGLVEEVGSLREVARHSAAVGITLAEKIQAIRIVRRDRALTGALGVGHYRRIPKNPN